MPIFFLPTLHNSLVFAAWIVVSWLEIPIIRVK
jgi:hypothetical protein